MVIMTEDSYTKNRLPNVKTSIGVQQIKRSK